MRRHPLRLATAACALALAGVAQTAAQPPVPAPAARTVPASGPTSPNPEVGPAGAAPHVSTTLVPGTDAYPVTGPSAPAAPTLRPGPVSLNLPQVDVGVFAKAVLGDVLHLPYAVDPAVHGVVTLVTPHSVAVGEVLPLAEDALKTSGLALEPRNGVYTIAPLDEAKAQAPVIGEGEVGYGQETLTLRYANPDELKKLIDPMLPGVIASSDPVSRTLVLTGSSGQRRAVRDLVKQFDMDWLKGMSFALYIPKNTDARLIAPELEKLINSPGSTVAGLVRLVAMERLNGIVAIAPRPEYLDDVRRWVEVLDREGESSERRLYVYPVQNGRATDLANVLVAAFGGTPTSGSNSAINQRRRSDVALGSGTAGLVGGTGASPNGPAGFGFNPAGSAGGSTPTLAAGLLGPGLGGGQSLPGQPPTAAGPIDRPGAADSLVITADETNNAVVAHATPREFALIEDALRRLDVSPLQVVIEVSIDEVTLNDALQYGVQWFFQTHGNQYALTQSSTSTSPIQNVPGLVYTVFSGGAGGAITATLNALSTVTHVQVLSAPNLLVLNNQTASLEVGDQVPISTGSAVSTLSAGAPVVNSVDYRDVGVILEITPRVNSSGLVLLDVSQEVSQVNTSSLTQSANPIASPVISERKIASSIAIGDGQTIALGGLISDNVSKTRSGVPVLSAIPVLGALVGARNETRQRTELLVLLTPRVIRGPSDGEAVTEELRRKIRVVEPIRPHFEP